MIARRATAVAAVLAAAIGASACGTSGPSAAEKRAEAAKVAKVRQQREQAARRRQALQVARRCDAQLGDLVKAEQELSSRLDVGLNYRDYGDQVGNVSVAYNAVDFKALHDMGCLSAVGLPAEKAFNYFIKAQTVWQDCFDDMYCSTDSIDPKLQNRWVIASRKADEAKQGLADLKTPAGI